MKVKPRPIVKAICRLCSMNLHDALKKAVERAEIYGLWERSAFTDEKHRWLFDHDWRTGKVYCVPVKRVHRTVEGVPEWCPHLREHVMCEGVVEELSREK